MKLPSEITHQFADGTKIVLRPFDDEIVVYSSKPLSFNRGADAEFPTEQPHKVTLFINDKF